MLGWEQLILVIQCCLVRNIIELIELSLNFQSTSHKQLINTKIIKQNKMTTRRAWGNLV